MNGYPRFGTKRFGDFLESLRPLKRCPFCDDGNASVNIEVEKRAAEIVYEAYVECWDCGVQTSSVTLKCPGSAAEECVKFWDMRP